VKAILPSSWTPQKGGATIENDLSPRFQAPPLYQNPAKFKRSMAQLQFLGANPIQYAFRGKSLHLSDI
jgi:hypothetical protein